MIDPEVKAILSSMSAVLDMLVDEAGLEGYSYMNVSSERNHMVDLVNKMLYPEPEPCTIDAPSKGESCG